ncbi:hypothetical protein BKI52_39375 [marine bacterium AO1-C]|nr:hypothetical protein BKI52_39375 [marine bacterium AO1-C]
MSNDQPGTGQAAASVSVVVCAHNEYQNLQKLLPGLLTQKFDNFEIIIVDDRSTDGSSEWLHKQSTLHSRLYVVSVSETHPNWNAKKYALVQGIKQATHEVILLTDADCEVVSPHWIQHMIRPFANTAIKIVLGFSPYFKMKGNLNRFIQFETFFTAVQYLSFTLWGKAYMGVGRNLAYRKELFQNGKIIEKYKSVTGGDDDLLINQLATSENTAICIHPKAHMKSIPKTSWKDWYQQKIRHLSVGKYYKSTHHLLLGGIFFTQTIVWFTLVLAGIYDFYVANQLIFKGIIFLFSLRMLVLLSVYKVIIRNLRIDINLWWIPQLEFLYIFYIFIIGTLAISRKKLGWKANQTNNFQKRHSEISN